MLNPLVEALPEVYQPIYGHPEFSANASRGCVDRLAEVLKLHDALARAFGRPLRVLDLGCAQGFFSLQLAERGAHVLGIDFLPENIALCQALAAEHPALAVRFEHDRIEAVVARLSPGEFDLVLGLSVFHHLAHAQGGAVVVGYLERIAE
ncbi:MAG: class I SAM-dependent methyltransferase, partial [Casimicrobiaceae bacterium]